MERNLQRLSAGTRRREKREQGRESKDKEERNKAVPSPPKKAFVSRREYFRLSFPQGTTRQEKYAWKNELIRRHEGMQLMVTSAETQYAYISRNFEYLISGLTSGEYAGVRIVLADEAQ